MKSLTCALTLGAMLSLTSAASNPQQFTVDTGYAVFIGNQTRPNTVAYLGIPYAQPPLNSLRWRAPLPLDTAVLASNKQTFDARSYPNFCVQGTTGNGDAGGAGTEDCLKVNIYAPTTATPESKLPVLFYIHGGGYTFGNPANWPFDHWVDQSPNVVIVSVYYRLDAFGFLAHSDFLSDPSLGDLNVGFLDQIQALQWAQKFIGAFGGDPTKVTINGQSAGGSSVELHMVANEPPNLFRAAIGQSIYRTPLPTPQQQVPLFETFSSLAGCGSGTTAQRMACLRQAPISAIAMAQDAPKNVSYNLFHVALDGKLIPDFPSRLISEGKFKNVPALVGACSNETLTPAGNITQSLQGYFPSLTIADINTIIPLYPPSDFANADQLQTDLTGDHSARCGREIISEAVTKKGNTAFTYRYNTPIPGNTVVFHSSENWMMFRGTSTGFNGTTTFQPQNATNIAFEEELIAYWLSFVRAGNPNTFKLSRSATWPAFSTGQRMVLQQDSASLTGSSSFAEEEPEDTVVRCQNAVSLVAHEQN